MASMRLKAGAFRRGPGASPFVVASRGTQHLHGLAGSGEGDVPGRSSGGIGKRYGSPRPYSTSNRYRGLGEDAPETILTTADPVDRYIRAIQSLISSLPEYHTVGTTPPSKTIVSSGRWDFQTHMGLIDFAASIYGVEDKSRFPGWREDPGFIAFFAIELLFGGFEMDRAFEQMEIFFEALGLPTSSRAAALSEITQGTNALRLRQVLDRVTRYIIGCEGGKVYGDPMVQYKGIGSAIADVVLGIGLVALL